jgi:hypothetical protein
MDAALPIASMGVAAAFGTAGAAKLADLRGSREAVAAFGLPRRFAGALGVLLPVAELATAALLIAGVAGADRLLTAGGIVASVLLAAFSAGMAVSLLRGRRPDCHCFGQLHSSPVSARTLARNGALLGVAAFVAGTGDPVLGAVAAAAVLFAAALLGLRTHTVEGGVGGLPPGRPAPGFDLPARGGGSLSLDGLLRPGRPLLLVFADPDCGPCIDLAPEVAEWQRRYTDRLTIAVIERAGERPAADADRHGRRNVLLQRDREVAEAFGVLATPSALRLDAEGRVEGLPASGSAAIRALVAGGEDAETGEPPATPEPSGGPFDRRELIGRAAAAWAAIPALIVAPAWASRGQIEIKCRHERCGNRCCPKKAKCRRRGSRKVCICRDGRPACRNRCCPETFVCRRRGRRRRCACPDGYVVCSGRCVRVPSDPRHCGRCGRDCPEGTSCVGGECVGGDGTGTGPGGSGGCDCPPGKACCDGRCTDLNVETGHCGECGRACPPGTVCCEGRCRDIRGDHDNCGRCGRRCPSGEVCSGGECRRRCRRGETDCGGSCVDTGSDPAHCGGCSGCTGPFDTGECCNGKCCDYNASACCAGGCRNLALDDANCGACGNACPPGQFCRFGTCSPF